MATRRNLVRGAVAGLVLAFAYLLPGTEYSQNAHYALVRALADGTATIDTTRHEVGDVGTGDVTQWRGHTYSEKAPGLAFVSVPSFIVLDAAGAWTSGDPTRALWGLRLVGVVVPAILLLACVVFVASRVGGVAPLTAALVTGAGTLLLPFTELYFSHLLATLAAFASFALLLDVGRFSSPWKAVFAAGALAGFGVVAEYPNAFVLALLGLYAIRSAPRLRRAAAFAAGAAVGVLPLVLYNWWAFGDPTHLSYEGRLSGATRVAGGAFGFSWPDLGTVVELLLGARGLLVLSPVLVLSAYGLVRLFRGGRVAEASLILAVTLVYLVFSASYYSPFGDLGPGPRYLIVALPFLAVPLAVAAAKLPRTTLALSALSVFQMTAVTATGPMVSYDGAWLDRLGAKEFTLTVLSFVGVTGWYSILPFFAAALGVLVVAAWELPLRSTTFRDGAVGLTTLAAWVLVVAVGENPDGKDTLVSYAICAAGASALVLVLADPRSRRLGTRQRSLRRA